MTTQQDADSAHLVPEDVEAPPLMRMEIPGGTTPMRLLRKYWFLLDDPYLAERMAAAEELGLDVTLRNRIDDDGDVVIDMTIYADEITIDPGSIDEWWGLPRGWKTVERVCIWWDDGWEEVLRDPRWTTHAARAVWLCERTESYFDELGNHYEERQPVWWVDISDRPLTHS